MAQITMPEQIPDNARVSDPACGSGRTLLEATRSNRLATFHGVDLDLRCVRMTALNLLCRNVNGHVIWGNSITLDAYGGYQLRRTIAGGEIAWITQKEAEELIKLGLSEKDITTPVSGKIPQEKKQIEQEQSEQYSLFV